MKHRIRRGTSQQPNLDSFLDILTNTVGVLVFVLLFVAISAADASILVRTPLRAETDKSAKFFEITGDRVVHLDDDAGSDRVSALLRSLPRANLYNLRYIVDRVYGFEATISNYRVDLVGSFLNGDLSTRYRLREDREVGTRLGALKSSDSEFQRILSQLDPEEDYVAFIVRPDAIEAFRAARDLAAKKGLATGWEPFEADRTIVFGRSGRTVGVQ
jgi:hypothetical protein